MFGQLKENILFKLEQVKSNPAELKKNFAEFTGALKESADLKKYYDVYDMVESAQFDNEAIAKEFLDECLEVLSKLNKGEVNKLKALAEGKNAKVSTKVAALDKILFENLSIKEKYDQKTLLIKSLTDKTVKPDFKEMISNLDKKVTTKVGKLTSEQKEALDLFIENDNSKITTYYQNLIEATIEGIENRILATESVEENRKLIEVKKKLHEMKGQQPNVDLVDSIIALKQDLSA